MGFFELEGVVEKGVYENEHMMYSGQRRKRRRRNNDDEDGKGDGDTLERSYFQKRNQRTEMEKTSSEQNTEMRSDSQETDVSRNKKEKSANKSAGTRTNSDDAKMEKKLQKKARQKAARLLAKQGQQSKKVEKTPQSNTPAAVNASASRTEKQKKRKWDNSDVNDSPEEVKHASRGDFGVLRLGVKYKDIQVGNGPVVQDRRKVRVNYTLRAQNKTGKIIDSGRNFAFRVGKGEVIKVSL